MDLTTSSHLALLSGWGSFASLFHVRTVLLEYKALLIIITFVNAVLNIFHFTAITAQGSKF